MRRTLLDHGPNRLVDHPDAGAAAGLSETRIAVGLPGLSGDARHRRQATLDERFGPDGRRIAHVVRGRVVPFGTAILHHDEAYGPEAVAALVTADEAPPRG